MSDGDLRAARRALRRGEQPPAQLLAELRRVVSASVAVGALPAALSPLGHWDNEAEDEVFQGWLAERLLQDGRLLALLDRARSAGAVRSMAERSLRHWLLNRRARSETQNLYARTAMLLESDAQFMCVGESSRRAQRWWTLAEHVEAGCFGGSEDQLLSIAFSLGEFDVIRYAPGAGKLSPVLGAQELRRFVTGLLAATGAGVSLGLIVITLQRRFRLDTPVLESLEETSEPSDPGLGVGERVALSDAARAVIAQLSGRQCSVLVDTAAGVTLGVMATEYGCSQATISNEQHRIAAALDLWTEDNHERDRLLKIVLDLLYEEGGHR